MAGQDRASAFYPWTSTDSYTHAVEGLRPGNRENDKCNMQKRLYETTVDEKCDEKSDECYAAIDEVQFLLCI